MKEKVKSYEAKDSKLIDSISRASIYNNRSKERAKKMKNQKGTFKVEAQMSDDGKHRYSYMKKWDTKKPMVTVITIYPGSDNVLTEDLTTMLIAMEYLLFISKKKTSIFKISGMLLSNLRVTMAMGYTMDFLPLYKFNLS